MGGPIARELLPPRRDRVAEGFGQHSLVCLFVPRVEDREELRHYRLERGGEPFPARDPLRERPGLLQRQEHLLAETAASTDVRGLDETNAALRQEAPPRAVAVHGAGVRHETAQLAV